MSSTPPPRDDSAGLIKESPYRFRVLGIRTAQVEYLKLKLMVRIMEVPRRIIESAHLEIHCFNAVDYAIRPRDPNCLDGGALMALQELDPERNSTLQVLPGSDGEERFDPPRTFRRLSLDQSYVITTRF